MKKIAYILALTALGGVGTSHASLLNGQSLAVHTHYPTKTVSAGATGGPTNKTYLVGSSVEIPNWFGNSSYIDFRDTKIEFAFAATTFFTPDPGLVSFFGGTPFNGYQFNDVNSTISPFTSVMLDSSLSHLPFVFSSSRISYNANNIWIDFQGLSFNADSKLVLNINTQLSPPVPEPETWSMLIAGLGLMCVAAKRKANTH